MPYRDQPTVQTWVADFFRERGGVSPDVVVLDQYYASGPDTGLIVVTLRSAPTSTYIQPVHEDGVARWAVTFEAREQSVTLDAAGVEKLASDLRILAELCDYLQVRTDAAILA